MPDISDELVYAGERPQGDGSDEIQEESRLEEGCYYLLFDQRSEKGRDEAIRRWVSYLFNTIALLNHAGVDYQRYWFPAYGLLPRWHHRRDLTPVEKPPGLTHLKLTWYSQHIEHEGIANALRPLLAQHGVTLETREVSYECWHQGEADSDIWLGSVNFTLPLAWSLFAQLYEIPLLHHCLSIDWQADAARWRSGASDWSRKRVCTRCSITGCCWKVSAACAAYG